MKNRLEVLVSSLVLFMTMGGGICAAQTGKIGSIEVSIVPANSPLSKVMITAIKHDSSRDFANVYLRNDTSKRITGVRFHLVEAVPDACSSGQPISFGDTNSDVPEDLDRANGLHLRPVSIPPHEEGSTITRILRPVGLVSVAAREKTPFLHVQLVLGAVQFSDGTTWHSPPPDRILNAALLDADQRRCRDFLATVDVPDFQVPVKEVITDNRTNAKETEHGYAFVCQIQDGKATCPR